MWRMCSADDDMTRCSRLYRTSCTLLPFVFCQLPVLVRGKAGVQKVCVLECVYVCAVSGEGGGKVDTGLFILLAFLMQSRSLRSFSYSPAHTNISSK